MSTPEATSSSADIVRRVYARSPHLASSAAIHVRENVVQGTTDRDRPNSGDAAMGEARLLRVLSGPHLGAEMSLRPGRYAIGTDENCDIVLSDSRLAARHAFLILSDDQVSIEPGDGAVTVDGAQVDGRVVVETGAVLERATVRGPAIIGAGAQVRDAYIGPYTAVGSRCVIERAEVEHSILLEGSSVRNLDGRMESSLLGRDVAISRGDRQPRAYRFMVGDKSEIGIL